MPVKIAEFEIIGIEKPQVPYSKPYQPLRKQATYSAHTDNGYGRTLEFLLIIFGKEPDVSREYFTIKVIHCFIYDVNCT